MNDVSTNGVNPMSSRNIVTGALAALILGGLAAVTWFPRSGFGSLHRTPESALLDSLDPGGWLGSGADIDILQLLETPEGRVALYVDENGNLGTADAKRKLGMWYAHGMFGLGRVDDVDCWLVPTSGTTVAVAAGRLVDGAVSVLVVDQDGNRLETRAAHDVWALGVIGTSLDRVHRIDASGIVISDTEIGACRWD